MNRVYVFIDGSNFYHLCRENLNRTDVNIGDFAKGLVGPDRRLVRIYYYNCLLPPDHPEEARRGQQRFIGALDRTAYLEVRLGKLVQRNFACRECGTSHSRWTEKGVLLAASKDLYDTAILVTGDGDLAEAVRAVKGLGRHVEVVSFEKGRAYELVQVADVFRELTAEDISPYFVKP